MASATRPELKPGLNEDLKPGPEEREAGSPSLRWAGTTALPKPATKRFIYVVRGETRSPTDSLSSCMSCLLRGPRSAFSHFAELFRGLSLFFSLVPSRGNRARCYTNDLILGLLQQVLLCDRPPILYISCLLSDVTKI